MICDPCANAADNRLDRASHCDARPGAGAHCTCQHRTDRYRPCTCRSTDAGLELCPNCPALPRKDRQ